MSYKYVTRDDEEYGKEEPEEGSGDDEFLLERAIQAWNNGDTEQWETIMSGSHQIPSRAHIISQRTAKNLNQVMRRHRQHTRELSSCACTSPSRALPSSSLTQNS